MDRRGKALCSVVVLGLGIVAVSSIPEMLLADSTLLNDFEPTHFSHQRQVFADPYAAVVNEYVVVGTQAEDVDLRVRPVVRGPERPDVRGFHIRSGEALYPRLRTAKENTMRNFVESFRPCGTNELL